MPANWAKRPDAARPALITRPRGACPLACRRVGRGLRPPAPGGGWSAREPAAPGIRAQAVPAPRIRHAKVWAPPAHPKVRVPAAVVRRVPGVRLLLVPARPVLLDAGRIGVCPDRVLRRHPGAAGMRRSSPSVHGRFERFKRFVGGARTTTRFSRWPRRSTSWKGWPASAGRARQGGRQAARIHQGRMRGGAPASWTFWDAAAPAAPQGECAYGEPAGCESFVEVPALPDDMDRRPYDKGFYHMARLEGGRRKDHRGWAGHVQA